ncbi:pilus (MSHA type) biogenesis protein MshL [Magnetofaba australis]|uniref:Putative pilus (MSHA type) biogenesis protein MshL n=1 Tax=Magnetofaba australis IT-1 TaxID=1434232 RepID=A0A1Y2K8D1_9PROT|nr:pilus (MSHA type) biogenesis protein MshL [Magnetofaba australis]OSM06879.1 putative pilus (MSHA type) biogenesis protein MshL [Magnetofaba australis IT-1]
MNRQKNLSPENRATAGPPRKGAISLKGLLLSVGLSGALLLGACSQPSSITPSQSHFLRPTDPPAGSTVERLPKEAQDLVVEYPGVGGPAGDMEDPISITVTDMPVRDLLFALARDAKKNIDIYPGITGNVTISAIDQSLQQILDRIANQVDLRYEFTDNAIIVSPDRPYLKIYQVDYVNMARSSSSTNRVATNIAVSASADPAAPDKEDPNQSTMALTTETQNHFWSSLTNNISAILHLNGDDMPTGDSVNGGPGLPMAPGAPGAAMAGIPSDVNTPAPESGSSSIVAINKEAGIVSIFATAREHDRIQTLLDSVLDNVQRQVLIESTVVEVELGDGFEQGVDWQRLKDGVVKAASNFSPDTYFPSTTTSMLSGIANDLPFFSLPIKQKAGSGATIAATVHALSTFGNTKVLSSPKIMALNNQSSILKVVDNKVFFTVEAKAGSSGDANNTSTVALINTNLHTVPVGLVMAVTPQISADDIVTLNVRPTISNISGWVNDPNPHLTTTNQIPEIQVKEMESILRIHSGQVAVMGGLMQDRLVNSDTGLPLLSKMPGLGNLFGHKSRTTVKTELVIFIRPVVMTHGKPRNSGSGIISASAKKGAQPTPVGGSFSPKHQPQDPAELEPQSNGGYLNFSNSKPSAAIRHSAPAPAPSQVSAAPQRMGAPINPNTAIQAPAAYISGMPSNPGLSAPPRFDMPQQMRQTGGAMTMAQPVAQPAMNGYGQQALQPVAMPNPYAQPQQAAYGQQQPMMYGQQQPAYGQQQPAYGQQQMMYGQQQPAYGQQQQPLYGQPQAAAIPTYQAPLTAYQVQQQPSMGYTR